MYVVALGEILIDFLQKKDDENKSEILYKLNPGGAPLNVLAALKKMNVDSSFVGCVGKDNFGTFLKEFVLKMGINPHNIQETNKASTTLAFVHLDDKGDRSFTFYRNPGADELIDKEKIDKNILDKAKVFHFGSLSLINEMAREATYFMKNLAKEKGILISYDPNLRENLWPDLDLAKTRILEGMKDVDILKISEEELEFLFKSKELIKNAKELIKTYNIKLIDVTSGEKGCTLVTKNFNVNIDGIKVKAVDTTGAGDSHLGAILGSILKNNFDIHNLSYDNLHKLGSFANKYSAIVTTKYGSASSMPSLDEVL